MKAINLVVMVYIYIYITYGFVVSVVHYQL